jgi:hypothetical protein
MLLLVVARGNPLEQAVLGGVGVAEREEAGRPVEEEPRDAEARGHVGGPRVAPVVDDAARALGQRAHVGVERAGEVAQGVEEREELVDVRQHVDALAVRRKVVARRRERELHKVEGQPGVVCGAAHPHDVERRGDDAHPRAAPREEPPEVDQRDEVALRHERDEHEVWRLRRRRRGSRERLLRGRRHCRCGCCEPWVARDVGEQPGGCGVELVGPIAVYILFVYRKRQDSALTTDHQPKRGTTIGTVIVLIFLCHTLNFLNLQTPFHYSCAFHNENDWSSVGANLTGLCICRVRLLQRVFHGRLGSAALTGD